MYQGNSTDEDFQNLPSFWKNVLYFFDRIVRYGGKLLDAPPEPKKPVKNWTILWFYIFHLTFIHLPLVFYIIYDNQSIFKGFNLYDFNSIFFATLIVGIFINTILLWLGIWRIIGNQYCQKTIPGRRMKTNIFFKIIPTFFGIIIVFVSFGALYSYTLDPKIAEHGGLGGLGAIFFLFIFYLPLCLMAIISENNFIKKYYEQLSDLEYSHIKEEHDKWSKDINLNPPTFL